MTDAAFREALDALEELAVEGAKQSQGYTSDLDWGQRYDAARARVLALYAERQGGTPESNVLWEARNWARRKPTPRSRAEAEAMVGQYRITCREMQNAHGARFDAMAEEERRLRAALLAALTGEGG